MVNLFTHDTGWPLAGNRLALYFFNLFFSCTQIFRAALTYSCHQPYPMLMYVCM
jgi:hypothetical protein